MRLLPRDARSWKNAGLRLLAVLLVLVVVPVGAAGACATMPGRSFAGPRPPPAAEEVAARARLEADVRKLAGEIGERHTLRPQALARAAAFVRESLAAAGYAVRSHEFAVDAVRVENLEAELPGTVSPARIVVVGAHYDSAHGTPGADDNASGTASLLELARHFAARPQPSTLRFVAFVNEEPPFFQNDGMGSREYARRCRERRDNIAAMLSLETMGYFTSEPGSQRYPAPFSLFYPSEGNFVGFVGNFSSRALARQATAAFRDTPLPSEGLAAAGWIPGLAWSDHWSFWQEGFEGVMVTDTAPFRNPHYHEATDTPDTLDYDALARVTVGLQKVVMRLAAAPKR